jgi:hypothetical protein
MTKFTQKSFSVSCASGGISDEELQQRWESTFGRKKPRAEEVPKAGKQVEEGAAEAEEPDEDGPLGKRPAGKKA